MTIEENDPTVAAILFSTWYNQIKKAHKAHHESLEIADLTDDGTFGPVLTKILAIQKNGVPFPRFADFGPVVDLCEQFMAGAVDLKLLAEVKAKAEENLHAITPFLKAFATSNQGDDFGMPMVIMNFGHPSSLARYISENIDKNGKVIGIDVAQQEDLRSVTLQEVTVLASGPRNNNFVI